MDQYYIYIHINKINNKVYIGQTNDIKRRWSRNGELYKTSPHFYSAIQKYGWGAFKHQILEICSSQDEANQKEKQYILDYNARDPRYGYNILEGGNSLGDYYSKEENRQKQSERCKKYMQTHPWEKQRLLKQLELANSPEKIALRQKTQKQNYANGDSPLVEINEKRKKHIICIETQECFDSLSKAAEKYKYYKVNIYNLSAHINHPDKRKSCGNINGMKLHWALESM